MSQLSTNSSSRCAARFCRLGDGDSENAVASRVFFEAVMEAPKHKVASNLVFVVDVSGSMSGSAENAVRETLKTVQLQAPKSTRVITYNSVAAEMSLAEYTGRRNTSTGFTYFTAAFKAMTEMVLEAKNRGQDMTFVFMTDGEDTQNAPKLLEDSMQQFKFATQVCRSVVTHVIGFGSVQAAFLEKVAATGSTAGTFRYASQVAELGAKFLDMYELSQSSVNCTVTIGTSPDPMTVELQGILVLVEAAAEDEEEKEKDESTTQNEFKMLQKTSHYKVEGLLPVNTTLSTGLDVTLSANGARMSCVLKCHGSASAMVKVKALEMCEVRNEADVTSIMETLSKIVPKGLSLVERMEMEEMRRSINDRLMSYLQVFNQMRLGQVNATSQLKLKDLRYEPHFSKVRRQRKVALRMNENMKMYSGIDERLQHLRTKLTPEDEEQLKKISEQYSCALTLVDLHELMTESADDFMCLGVQISRDELILDCPNTGFRLKSVSSTIVSYNAFVDAMNKAIAEKGGKSAHGGFKVANKLDQYNPHEDKKAEDEEEDDEPYCVVGQAREKINAVVPLYLHKRHFDRVLHLLPSWAGYFFALNPFAYEKNQEVAMFAMLGSMIMDHSGTAHYQQNLLQYAKVCAEVMRASKNFKFACPPEKYTAFVETVKGRRTSQFPNLVTVFGMAFAKDVARCDDKCEVISIFQPVYWEACKRLTMNRYAGSKLPAHAIAKELLYGDEASAAKQRALDEEQSELPEEVKSVKAEIAFAAYFMDPASNAVPQIQLESKDEAKEQQQVVLKPLSTEAITDVIVDRMEAVPNFIKTFYTKWMKFKHHEPEAAVKGPDCAWDSLAALPFADKEVARRHLLLAYFYYNEYCPDHVTEDNILQVADEKFQTDQRNRDNNDARDVEEDVLAEVIASTSDLVAFGGMLRVYCPTRANKVFHAIVTRLVRNKDNEKMGALMRNAILGLPIYEGPLLSSVWRPSGFSQLRQIRDMLGKSVFEQIEREHRGNNHVLDWLYRISDKPNRCGHCNSNPWKGHRKPFTSYAGVFS